MKVKIYFALLCVLLSGCNTMPIYNLADETTCVTEIASKKSNFKCQLKAKKIVAKK